MRMDWVTNYYQNDRDTYDLTGTRNTDILYLSLADIASTQRVNLFHLWSPLLCLIETLLKMFGQVYC